MPASTRQQRLLRHQEFTRFIPGCDGTVVSCAGVAPHPDQWVDTAPTPSWPTDVFATPNGGEIGPLLLLHNGQVLVLGGNTKNGIYTPPGASGESFLFTQDTPDGYNHGDSPSAVEANGNVLSVVTADPKGNGTPGNSDVGPYGKNTLYEYTYDYQSSTGTWAHVASPPVATGVSLGAGDRARLLNLPQQSTAIARVLLTGMSDGSWWVYGSSNTPSPNWRPTVPSISSPVNGVYTLTGTQLNGLTSGANLGDDGKMATNYPLVYLQNGILIYYARTFNFDQMAPRPLQIGTCSFTLPPNLPNGTYQVHVTANGVDSSATSSSNVQLTVNETHVSSLSGNLIADLDAQTTWTVTLSAPAPAAGTVVKLASSMPGVATVLASVNVPPGQTQMTFPVKVTGFGITTISAVTSGNAAFGAVNRNFGWNLNDLSGPDIPYYGNDTQTTFALTTSQPAPSKGLVVQLAAADASIASVPATVRVPAGATTVSFPVTRIREGVTSVKASVINSFFTKAVSTADRPRIGAGGDDDGDAMSFIKCANEGGTCAVGGPPRYLAYGANKSFLFKTTSGNVPCNSTQFGNPNSGQTNACYFSSYGFLAAGGAKVTIPPSQKQVDVAYGAKGAFVFKKMTGTFTCDDNTFPNATKNTPKACYYGPVFYDMAVDEGLVFSVNPNTPIAYGAVGKFNYKIMSGSVTCDNATFGDPDPGTGKSCYVFAPPFRADESGTFSTSGLTPTYYGSGSNGDFMVSSATSGTCSNSFFGADPDINRRKHCFGL